MLLTIYTIPTIVFYISKPLAKNDTRLFPVKLQIRLDKEVWSFIHTNKCIHINFHDEVSTTTAYDVQMNHTNHTVKKPTA